ncbi:MAG: tetratricopeptide repeat protein, partial [Planctomycetota bacterium]
MRLLFLGFFVMGAVLLSPHQTHARGRGGVRVGGYSGVGVPVVGWYGAGVGFGVGGPGYVPGLPTYTIGPPMGGNWGGWGYWGGRPWWSHPGYNGWHNGYWPRWGGAVMPQSGQSVQGLAEWALGSAMYASGYRSYRNPFQSVTSTATGGADYSRPVSMMGDRSGGSSSPAPVDDEAMRLFAEARRQFHSGGYERALQLVDAAIAKTPQDTVMQEFRALALFALGRYEQAATTIHSVLASSPGWDWTTLSGLYFSQDIYRFQLRKLESYAARPSASPAAEFLLAYHYLTMGHNEQAAEALRKYLAREPDDQLGQRLLAIADPAAAKAARQKAPPLGRLPL